MSSSLRHRFTGLGNWPKARLRVEGSGFKQLLLKYLDSFKRRIREPVNPWQLLACWLKGLSQRKRSELWLANVLQVFLNPSPTHIPPKKVQYTYIYIYVYINIYIFHKHKSIYVELDAKGQKCEKCS